MAIASVVTGLAGIVLSFILGFPVSLVIGPYVGIALGIVGLALAVIARRKQKSGMSMAGLIIGAAVVAISILRIVAFVNCVGNIAACIGGLA